MHLAEFRDWLYRNGVRGKTLEVHLSRVRKILLEIGEDTTEEFIRALYWHKPAFVRRNLLYSWRLYLRFKQEVGGNGQRG